MAASKTVRFSELVEKAGRPEIHLSWTAPANDPALQGAVKQNRVVTLHQQFRGTQKDFGVVGLELGKDVQFLIFPKSLKAFAGRRVVGIKYGLFQEAEPTSSKEKKPKVQRTKAKKPDAEEDDRVIAFPAAEPAKPEKAAKLPKREAPRQKTVDPVDEPEDVEEEESAPAEEEQDPVKAEVQKALDALSAGRVAEAKRRLRGLLDS